MSLQKVEIVLKGTGKREKRTIQGYFIDLRRNEVPAADIPEGFANVYDCRHGDGGDWCTPVTIEERVWINHSGTLFLSSPLQLKDGMLLIQDFCYC